MYYRRRLLKLPACLRVNMWQLPWWTSWWIIMSDRFPWGRCNSSTLTWSSVNVSQLCLGKKWVLVYMYIQEICRQNFQATFKKNVCFNPPIILSLRVRTWYENIQSAHWFLSILGMKVIEKTTLTLLEKFHHIYQHNWLFWLTL